MTIHINTYNHSKEETNSIVRGRTSGIGGRVQTWTDHRFRVRCRAILLKSGNLSKEEVTRKPDVVTPSVFNRTKRYGKEGISGLKTKPGQGRKPIMDSSDEPLVREAVSQERQSVKTAKTLWEASSGKKASDITFKRFLEVPAQDISVSRNAQG